MKIFGFRLCWSRAMVFPKPYLSWGRLKVTGIPRMFQKRKDTKTEVKPGVIVGGKMYGRRNDDLGIIEKPKQPPFPSSDE